MLFDAAGLLGFTLLEDPVDYEDPTSHTNRWRGSRFRRQQRCRALDPT